MHRDSDSIILIYNPGAMMNGMMKNGTADSANFTPNGMDVMQRSQ